MLPKEKNYEFRKRMLEIHKKGIRDVSLTLDEKEFEIKNGMSVVIDKNASVVIETAAKDFIDYLYTSMDISVILKKGTVADGEIYVGTKAEVSLELGEANSYKGFVVETTEKIVICGFDDRGAAQALYMLENEMSTRRAPFIEKGTVRRKPLFSPRMLHSGYGLDEFPDEHLSAIAHSGRDAILVFAKGPNITPYGYLDFNELIHRAAKYGIDVYAYSYLKITMHPDEPGAEEAYDAVYGKLFRECPGLKGITLVGESVEFASKDPRVSKCGVAANPNEIPTGKPRPGWFPCEDFPKWIELVKKSVRKYNADADIVFWTYNWGWAPEKDRIALIEKLPTDISLQVTYEMFHKYDLNGITECCSDYTLVFEGPGEYFTSEAEAAKKRGIRLYSMTNTGGLTWDMGVIPYEPMPYQWMRRYKGLRKYNESCGLCGLMESHHFGFYPSFIGDLSNYALCQTEKSMEEHLKDSLQKWFGTENVSSVDKALKCWSEAIRKFTPSNEDQYGPFRVGPSYPLVLKRVVNVPCFDYAMFKDICYTDYPKYPSEDQPQNTVEGLRIPKEIPSLEEAKKLMAEGIEILEVAENKNEELLRLINLGKFIVTILKTGINVKKWYINKARLLVEQDKKEIDKIFEDMIKIAEDEIENAKSAIPLVEQDSRLGYEPSMEYVCHKENIEWKIRHTRYVIDTEIPKYRKRFN